MGMKKAIIYSRCQEGFRFHLTDDRSLCELESRIMATSLRSAPHLRIFERLQASVDSVKIMLMQCRLSLSLSGFAMFTAMSISQAATMASAVLSM